MKNKINWWIIAAIIIIGIPIGYVSMGIIERMHKTEVLDDTDEIAPVVKQDSVSSDIVAISHIPETKEFCDKCGEELSKCKCNTSPTLSPSEMKCKTCGKVMGDCEFGGKHPKCNTCGKLMEQCPYQGKHPEKVCETCNRVLSLCDYRGKHPKCNTCGKLIKQCPYQGKHPEKVCETCNRVLSLCDYKGKHPVCTTCKKLVERCDYKGKHPICNTCKKLIEKCQYKGDHPTCSTCNKPIDRCPYKGNHPICKTCSLEISKCPYKGKHPIQKCGVCGKELSKCQYGGEKGHQEAIKKECTPDITIGKSNSKIPGNCSVIVNGRKMDYQNFSTGVQYKVYMDVKVTDITTDSKGNVTQIKVTATEQKD